MKEADIYEPGTAQLKRCDGKNPPKGPTEELLAYLDYGIPSTTTAARCDNA